MSKLDFISTEIVFHGEDIVETLKDNWLAYEAIWKQAKKYLNAKIAIHASSRTEMHGPIEWSMSVTSPTGRQTFRVFQRSPTGSVSFTQG